MSRRPSDHGVTVKAPVHGFTQGRAIPQPSGSSDQVTMFLRNRYIHTRVIASSRETKGNISSSACASPYLKEPVTWYCRFKPRICHEKCGTACGASDRSALVACRFAAGGVSSHAPARVALGGQHHGRHDWWPSFTVVVPPCPTPSSLQLQPRRGSLPMEPWSAPVAPRVPLCRAAAAEAPPLPRVAG